MPPSQVCYKIICAACVLHSSVAQFANCICFIQLSIVSLVETIVLPQFRLEIHRCVYLCLRHPPMSNTCNFVVTLPLPILRSCSRCAGLTGDRVKLVPYLSVGVHINYWMDHIYKLRHRTLIKWIGLYQCTDIKNDASRFNPKIASIQGCPSDALTSCRVSIRIG